MASTHLKAGQTSQKQTLQGGSTSRRGGQQPRTFGLKTKKDNKSQLRTTQSEKEQQIVMFDNKIATPKPLVTKAWSEMAKNYGDAQEQVLEKSMASRATLMKGSTSLMESSFRGVEESMDKSSSSDIKMSSSNVNERSSQMDSKDESESEDGSRRERIERKRQKKKPKMQLDDDIAINLEETKTQIYFMMPSKMVPQEKASQQKLDQKNKQYQELLKQKIGSDNFMDRAAQTFQYQPKEKKEQTIPIIRSDMTATVTTYDLFDTAQQEQLTDFDILQNDIKMNIDKELQDRLTNPFCQLPLDMKSILIHSKMEVPGEKEFKEKQAAKEKTGKFQSTQLQTHTERDDTQNSSNFTSSKLLKTQTKRTQQTGLKADDTTAKFFRSGDGTTTDLNESANINNLVKQLSEKPSEEEVNILKQPSLMLNLSYIERLLNQATYQKKYLLHRNYPEVKIEKAEIIGDGKKLGGRRPKLTEKMQDEENQENEEKEQQALQYLLSFNCDVTRNRTISSADYNTANKDLLAVSYGEYEVEKNSEGLICFWTIKNPSFPERIIRYPSRITTCKFSESNPNLLAMGTQDGVVAIYDIRKKSNQPIFENNDLSGKGKHSDAVWEVQWIGRGGAKAQQQVADKETLISISSDGRVVEWSMKKGLEFSDLMNLKKQSHPNQKDSVQEGVNFRAAAGFSFDFIRGESNMYLVSTEEGSIHKCSKSYAEQYLESYFGHTGPVYKVRCNPFWPDVFLSCSADWSCKLWNWHQDQALHTFKSLDIKTEVMDTDWSPNCSTLFSLVAKDGRLEIWDLKKKNMLDPFYQITPPEGVTWPAKTMVRFHPIEPVLITGDTAGDLGIYRLRGYEDNDPKTQKDQLQKLLTQNPLKGKEQEN